MANRTQKSQKSEIKFTPNTTEWLKKRAGLDINIIKEMMNLPEPERADFINKQDLGERTPDVYLLLSDLLQQNPRNHRLYMDAEKINAYWETLYPGRNVSTSSETIPSIKNNLVETQTSVESELEMVQEPSLVPIKISRDKSEVIDLFKKAINENNIEEIKKLVEEGKDINVMGKDLGWTPLHLAAYWKDIDFFKEFIEIEGIDINAKNSSGDTALHLAIPRNPKIANALIEKGADINIKNERGNTPLYLAVVTKNEKLIDKLISKGADLDVVGSFGTPLHLAVHSGESDIVKKLLDAGANVNVRNLNNNFPITTALRRDNDEITKLLIEEGKCLDGLNQNDLSFLYKLAKENNRSDEVIDLIQKRRSWFSMFFG